jgi:hypothetical protein
MGLRRRCSLIVVSSRGRTGVAQAMLRSQIARTISTSPVPVPVVP